MLEGPGSPSSVGSILAIWGLVSALVRGMSRDYHKGEAVSTTKAGGHKMNQRRLSSNGVNSPYLF